MCMWYEENPINRFHKQFSNWTHSTKDLFMTTFQNLNCIFLMKNDSSDFLNEEIEKDRSKK